MGLHCSCFQFLFFFITVQFDRVVSSSLEDHYHYLGWDQCTTIFTIFIFRVPLFPLFFTTFHYFQNPQTVVQLQSSKVCSTRENAKLCTKNRNIQLQCSYISIQSSSRSSRVLYFALTNAAKRSGAVFVSVDYHT